MIQLTTPGGDINIQERFWKGLGKNMEPRKSVATFGVGSPIGWHN